VKTRSFEVFRPKKKSTRRYFRRLPTLTEKIQEIKKSPAFIGCNYQSMLVLFVLVLILVIALLTRFR